MSRLKIVRAANKVPKALGKIGTIGVLLFAGACASAVVQVPPPRSIIIHSGARIRADHEHMKVVNEWVTREDTNITDDPSFLVITSPADAETFPWEGMVLGQDSVTIHLALGARDAALVYRIYGHLHLMVQMGRQEEWLPEAPAAVGYELERAIVERIADAWILGRTVFDTAPFGPLDELAYSFDADFLDAFIFTARPSEFAASRAEWARANPGETDRYRDWFLQTFNREPPGIRAN